MAHWCERQQPTTNKDCQMIHDDDFDLSYDFETTKTTRRAAGNGPWVCSRLHGYRFEALVFPEHAEDREWELDESKISRLFIQRLVDRQIVFSWDKGPDVPAADETVAAIIDFLAIGCYMVAE